MIDEFVKLTSKGRWYSRFKTEPKASKVELVLERYTIPESPSMEAHVIRKDSMQEVLHDAIVFMRGEV